MTNQIFDYSASVMWSFSSTINQATFCTPYHGDGTYGTFITDGFRYGLWDNKRFNPLVSPAALAPRSFPFTPDYARATTIKTTHTRALIECWPNLPDDARSILLGAIATRGKYQDYLLSNAPDQRKRPQHWIAWQALVSNLAPQRCSTYSLMCLSAEDQKLFHYLNKALERSGLDSLLNAFEPPYRWNLYAYRINTDKLQTATINALLKEGVPVSYSEISQ